ncbi:MAG: phosphoenolpyruvate--protein phosphotransferase [Planctomycetota bacterium]|jgi:phosphotransferase system enzyme I (PtsI)|nr:phosphoenolpyruvate--protein phosphotransferase [Planctomycetota bacterium]
MREIQGKGVGDGVAIGKIYFFSSREREVKKTTITDDEAETTRFNLAHAEALKQIQSLQEKALQEVGEKDAAVFEIHQMMLEDQDYLDSVQAIIKKERVNAEYAVSVTRDDFARSFSEMDDPYMQGRAADVRDVSNRLLDCLEGKVDNFSLGADPVILAARDLTPSETLQLDKSKVLAFVTSLGSSNSHTAILARTLGLPAVIGAGDALTPDLTGSEAIVDGFTGKVYLDPSPAILAEMRQKQEVEAARQKTLEQFKGKPTRTLDGRELLVYANIGSTSELELVNRFGAEGIGLFRSEFLFIGQDTCPDEESQFACYRKVAKDLGGKRAIIRTLDIGADKQAAYLNLEAEDNPALGLRGLRLCLERPEIFKTQLRALLRASAFGKIAIMFPMVAAVWEVVEAKKLIQTVREELTQEGRGFNPEMEIGIMIETPAAALLGASLAKVVDFFSIGTNDLTQYTLAVDRQNARLDRYGDPHHPAVLLLIENVIRDAHQQGIWVGVCGELAGDLELTETLLRYGVDELSVSPPRVLALRQRISECSATP